MGEIVSSVTDAIGITDSKAGDRAADSALQAAQIQADFQREALDYLKEQDKLPTEIREATLPFLAATFGIPGYEGGYDMSMPERGDLTAQAMQSPLYQAQVQNIQSGLGMAQQAGEDAILRNAAATGGLRSGNVQSNLASMNQDLQTQAAMAQNQALMDAYMDQRSLFGEDVALRESEINRMLGGMSGLAGLPSNANAIAGMTSNIGQTLAQGQTAAAQAQAAGSQQNIGNLMGLGNLGIAAYGAGLFSDRRLKKDIKQVGFENGHNVYKWTWNDKAKEFGLEGNGYGVIADEVEKINPEAVTIQDGYKKVKYEMIGVNHG